MYDTIIVGGGAAGLSAAIYSGRYGHSTLCIKGEGFEGSTLETWAVENYPGYLTIDGPDLVQTLEKQAENAGAKLVEGHIKKITNKDDIFNVTYNSHCEQSKTVIYATGTIRRKLGLLNEEELKGRGVSYCATCDGPIFRNKKVGVVGGGDSAAKAALILAQYTEKVYVFVREPMMIAEPINQENLKKNPKIETLLDTKITEFIEKDGRLSGIKLGNEKVIDLEGIFIEIGGMANTESIKELDVDCNEAGYIKVSHLFSTNLPGFFAAGDVTNAFDGFRQIITAAAGGATAAHSAHNFLTKK